jgi:hypothetical protein
MVSVTSNMIGSFELPGGPVIHKGETVDYDALLFTNKSFLDALVKSGDLVFDNAKAEKVTFDTLPEGWKSLKSPALKAVALEVDDTFDGNKEEAILTIEIAIEDKAE